MIYIAILCNSRITAELLYNTLLFIGPYAAANNAALLAWRPSQGTKLYCLVNRGTLGVNNLPRVIARIMPRSELNPRPLDHESNALPLHHRVTRKLLILHVESGKESYNRFQVIGHAMENALWPCLLRRFHGTTRWWWLVDCRCWRLETSDVFCMHTVVHQVLWSVILKSTINRNFEHVCRASEVQNGTGEKSHGLTSAFSTWSLSVMLGNPASTVLQ